MIFNELACWSNRWPDLVFVSSYRAHCLAVVPWAELVEGEHQMTATAPDYDEIVRVVQLYVDGFNDSDMSKFKEAFDQDAWIFYVDPDGVLQKRHLADDTFSKWATPGPRKVRGRIISVTQAGDAANVLLGFDTTDQSGTWLGPEVSWVDFHSLLRINGVWKITNKTATHATRAAWAADRNVETRKATLA